MPEENNPLDIQRTLDLLEDPMLNPLARGQHYKAFNAALDSSVEIDTQTIDRFLVVCVQDLEDDKKSIICVLKIIQSILKRIKAKTCSPLPNLLPSILAVLNIIKTSALMSKVETMQTLCFEILLSYPNETLIEIASLHTSEVVEVLNLYCHQQIPLEIRVLPCSLILKLLKILPPEKKSIFVKDNLSVWFSKVIPTTIVSVINLPLAEDATYSLKPLETLECLTDELVPIDYAENPQWLDMLECIHSPSKYPAAMRRMLSSNSNKWHRLWIVFIRLLKHQITKTTFSQASPINSMLPVVEQAFKMDVTNRCRAFQCWEVLIDNFRTETNEAYIVKRLKLLIIPLKSNNAKVEETALAKLQTWWHLIQCYQSKLDKFVDKVLISFLHFCFGRHVGMSPKSSLVPGLLSANTKRRAVETFVELAGHLCCNGCVNVPKLNRRIISKSILVDHWNDWVFSLKMAITILNEDVGLTVQQIECLWKSFVMTVAELPDNNIRKDLFNELLSVLEKYEKEPDTNSNLAKIVFQLLASLFGEEKIKVLFKPKVEQGPIYKILLLLLSPSFNAFYKSGDTADIVKKLKPLAMYMLEVKPILHWLLNSPAQQNLSFILTAFAESVYESKCEDIGEFIEFMFWPLKSTNIFIDVNYSTKVWVLFVKYMYPKIKANIKDKLRTAISRDIVPSNTHLKLQLCIAILNEELDNYSVSGCLGTKNIESLMMVTNRIEDYKYVNDNLIILADTVFAIVNIIKGDANSPLLKTTLTIIKNLLKFMNSILEGNNETDKINQQLYEMLLNNIEVIIQNNKHSPLTTIVVDELTNCTIHLHKYPLMKKSVIKIMKIYLTNSKDSDSFILNKVKDAVANLELTSESCKQDKELINDEKFAAPSIKSVTKKGKKKETAIVNTVVENGEEYEVIKSNWKFNPRKLTENQKEKLQRKREDIPALYQDLSQSQDDFKLSSWKTESQDTSSTNSKSTTNSKSGSSGNVSEILKNIPSSDVVPKIIENIFSEKNNDVNKTEEKPVNDTTNKIKQTAARDPKSPRMALKDRVFRNVRNLIEKSSVQKDTKDLSESLIQVENVPKTPVSKATDNSHMINSAPPNLGAERPARLKRKPRKFDDLQIFSLKKSRRSSSLNESQSDSQELECQEEIENAEERSPPANDVNVEKSVSTENNARKEHVATENSTAIPSAQQIEPAKLMKVNEIESEPVCHDMQKKNDGLDKESAQVLDSSGMPESTSVSLLNKPINTDKDINVDRKDASEQDEKDVSIECTPQESSSGGNSGITKVVGDLPVNDISVVKPVETVTETDSNSEEHSSDKASDSDKNSNKNTKTPIRTPKTRKQELAEPKSGKRNSARKSRIEKELAIDTVEGHPFLKIQTEKRITRKNLNSPLNNSRRKSLTDKINKSKVESKTPVKTPTNSLKKKDKETSPGDTENVSITIGESQDKCSEISDDHLCSEDVIESSQDSTFTTISAKSAKPALKRLSVVVQKVPLPTSAVSDSIDKTMDIDDKDDTELPQNITAAMDKTDFDLTENMDTQPVDNTAIENHQFSDVIIINDEDEPIVISSETQDIADADTQPANPSSETMEIAETDTQPTNSSDINEISLKNKTKPAITLDDEVHISNVTTANTEDDVTTTMNNSMDASTKPVDDNTASSPFKDLEQRKKDFLDNTLEISPIKTMSPVRDKKSPSPETSSDYVLIKLSSPVQSNGEPFEKCDSPEIFTEDKVSPDKRDLSPPREEATVSNTSPSSSLSLKKNRPQVRSGGRAAQMLGLCVPDRLQTIISSERSEPEEPKKNSPSNTPARRNLRILYNSVGDGNENSEENEDSENFLKFKRMLPTSDCSPAGPILKRKLAEITDEATVSPASKRKRVSFHDPPVSTMIAVQKYIEPCGIRSPQNSAHKRQERQNLRSQAILIKSPKRLDNVFKLDTVLTKAVESFTETDQSSTDITQSISLDETPAVEIVKTSDLNNVDPIYAELVDCNDAIDVIAAELTSATMKPMFLKEVAGKITTVSDLAKMTELEVNRLCIKAPKVKVARKVLSDYSSRRIVNKAHEVIDTIEILEDDISPEVKTVDKIDMEVQTNETVTSDAEMQTFCVITDSCVQTDKKVLVHTTAQTNESGVKSTKEIISSCLAERTDFVENLCEQLEESSKRRIAENLPANMLTSIFMKNVTSANSRDFITRILQKQNGCNTSKTQSGNELLYLQNYLCDRFDNRDLIMFCSQLLAEIHSKPS